MPEAEWARPLNSSHVKTNKAAITCKPLEQGVEKLRHFLIALFSPNSTLESSLQIATSELYAAFLQATFFSTLTYIDAISLTILLDQP